MNILVLYFITGMLLYPSFLDMYYRICYKSNEFHNPNNISWYFGYSIFVTTWIVTYPLSIFHYLKEMKNE